MTDASAADGKVDQPSAQPTAEGRGILAGVGRLERWLPITLVLLTLASVARYLQNHRFDDRAGPLIAGATVLLVGYGVRRRVPWRGTRWWPAVWTTTLVLVWAGLVAAAPSFAWCAVPLAFVALRMLPFAFAVGVVALMVLTVSLAWTSMRSGVDPTVFAGPAVLAVLAVIAYEALENQARARQRLLEDLRSTQGELADAQHRAGAAAERARLSRDIHDSVAQGLTSINLLLLAAEQDWDARPGAARRQVQQAARTARDGLVEVRGVVRDLSEPELTDDGGLGLPEALRAVAARIGRPGGLAVAVAVHGGPVRLPDDVATALLRTARGALANVVEHARATHATATLTYQPGSVSLDVWDDGCGFDPVAVPRSRNDRGHGLAGVHARVAALGGEVAVESAPGEGTALAVTLPVSRPDGRP